MNESQKRAVANHRERLKQRGFARYEVRGLARDKEWVRRFAQRLAANDETAQRLRQELTPEAAPREFRTGKDIWDALRRSPLVGLNLKFKREVVLPRDLDL